MKICTKNKYTKRDPTHELQHGSLYSHVKLELINCICAN
ncbi:unnamed protein product [Prunus brigantina]